jgi:hypothetical protein
MTEDELRQYLEDNGYPKHIVSAGRMGLIGRWREFVEEVESGYRYGLEDYRNDLDLRAIIALAGLDQEEAVKKSDEQLDHLLTAKDTRVWESMDSDPFWDFGYPRNATGDLLRDLKSEHLTDA